MKIGILTLADYYPELQTPHGRLTAIVDEAVEAEALSFDSFWVGEHHFSRYICPNPATMLTAIAARTSRIRIGTGVALAVHHQPLRLAEDYAMVDVLSGGRLDLVLGRGIYLAGYDGFGQAYAESRARIEEAATILRGVWEQPEFTHAGQFTDVRAIELQPRPVQARAPLWIGGGRGNDSALWAAREGYHLAMPSVLGPVLAFEGLANAYRQGLKEAGHDPAHFQVSAGQHCYVGEDGAAAHAYWAPYYHRYLRLIAAEVPAERYAGTDLERAASGIRQVAEHFDFEQLAEGSLLCGAAAEVADRIIEAGQRLRLTHFWAYFDLGGLPVAEVRRSMERFARDVMPAVRAALPG